ncbi:amidohydrolase family protein [Georgenia sp. MJ206]|uniref:amidohydrolase n=1 Tax=Georgenia wangjunii TaxID=3117730 RepID=UPI002F26BD07
MGETLLLREARLVPVHQHLGGAYAWRARGPEAAAPAPRGTVDIRVADGAVRELAPTLERHPGEPELDLDGRWVLPGLWDQHLHSTQWASAGARLDVSAAASAREAAAMVAAHMAARPPAAGAVVQGFGFRDALWPDLPTRALLDTAAGGAAVILVSGDCHCGWLSSAAAESLGLPHGEGLVTEHAWFEVTARLDSLARGTADHAGAMADAARRGVVGIVDVEWAPNHRLWPERVAAGLDALRVRAGVYPDHLDEVLRAGLRSGDLIDGGAGLVTMGPLKVITDGSLNTRTAFCHDPYGSPDHASGTEPAGGGKAFGQQNVPPAELTELLRRAVAGGLHVAAHAIGDGANTIALDAFATTGGHGSIEHAQLLARADIARFAELGIVASVQPAHLLDDRDVAEACWPGRTDRMFPLRDLLAARAQLAFGSDAPVAPLDPWLAMAAAVHRSADDRAPWHDEQHLTPGEALAASTDGWGTVAVGHPGDLAVLDDDPLARTAGTAEAAAHLRSMRVALTVVGGRVTHRTL